MPIVKLITRASFIAILAAFITGALFSFVVLYIKFDNPTFPLTHWFNQLSYFVKNGFVIIINDQIITIVRCIFS